MNKQSVFVLFTAMILMASPLVLTTPEAGAEDWTQTTDSDFLDGESFFVDIDGGSLKLTRTLSEEWTAVGEAASDFFGTSVASAGDVNGDGYDDVIVGAYGNDGAGSLAGEAYVYYGSSSGLCATPDWSDQGESAGDSFGYSVAAAGDVNGDGYDDVIVGAYDNDDGGADAGEAYVYFGSSSGLSATPDWSDQGEAADDQFGECVATAGDVNGDGYDDVIIGAYGNDGGGGTAGEAYVYYGSSSGLSATPDWSDQGEAGNNFFGESVAAAGDVNGDGYADVIVGAWGNSGGGSFAGEAYVYFGSSSGPSATPDWSDQGEASSDYFGESVAAAGDVNGDGYADVIVGAHANDGGGSAAGEAYVYFGSSSGPSATPDWSVQGEAADNSFGYSVAAAGDVNNDGCDDVIVGAHYNDEAGSNAGEAYIYHGSSSGLSATPVWSDQGETVSDELGESVAAAGDVNGDGYADVIVGASRNDDGGSMAGKVYLYSYGLSSDLSSTPDWTAVGDDTRYEFGKVVASAGDVNGDGYDEVIVYAMQRDDYEAGEVNVYHGSSSGLSATPDWTKMGANSAHFGTKVAGAGDVNGDGYDDMILTHDGGHANGQVEVYYGSSSGLSASLDWSVQGEGSSDQFGSSVDGAGDVNGDGYDDVIIGASRYDSNKGKAYLYLGSSSGLSSTADWTDTGETAGDYFGVIVAGAGDVNGDGYDDVVVSAPYNDDGGTNAGEVYLYRGSPHYYKLSPSPFWTIQGDESDGIGFYALSSAGDVNGDGYADVIIGNQNNDDAGTNAGKAKVYHGSSSGLSATADWSDLGERAGDIFGRGVASAGDVNGDGYDDVIVGAPGNDDAEPTSGKVYIYYGSSSGLCATPSWSDPGEGGMDEGTDAYFAWGVAKAGDVNGDGYGDVIIGSIGNDTAGVDAGKAYVYHGHGYVQSGAYDSPVLDLGASACHPDWLSISWNTGYLPQGTSVKAQIATSNDSVPTNWRGPDGSSTSYYQTSGGQSIWSWEQGSYLKVRFYLESDSGEPGDVVGIREGDLRTPSLTDFSISYGRFTTPSVTLNWPNGGENLMHGETYDVIWETTGDLSSTDPVALSYRLDGGSWVSITTATENDGEYRWTLPSNEDVERALVKVVATAVDGSTVSDTCDMTFSIDPPPVNPETGDRVISPAAAEELEKGSTVVVEWQLAGEETVSLHYSTDFGQSWQPIVENIINFGSYHWELPDDMTSEHMTIKVQGAQESVVSNLFIVGEGVGAEDEKEAKEEDSQRIPAVLGSLTGLLIICFVVLALVVREKPEQRNSSRSNSQAPNTSQEETK